MNSAERQAWFDYLQARSLVLDETPVLGSKGRVFRRTRQMACPMCGVQFFAYQCDQEPMVPGHNPEPPIVHGISTGRRETCSHPLCVKAEIQHQQERIGTAYHRVSTTPPAPSPTPTTRGRGIQKLQPMGAR